MKKPALLLLLITVSVLLPAQTATKLTTPQLIALAQSNNPGLHDAIFATFDPKDLIAGTASSSRGPDFFFAAQYPTQPSLVIDEREPIPMQQVASTSSGTDKQLWYATARINEVGHLHAFHYTVPGGTFGGRLDLPALGPLSYLQPGVPSGKLSDPITHISQIYDGMKSTYRIYVPAQYDPKTPAALMVFQDGGGFGNRDPGHGILDAVDNLTAQKKIPIIVYVFVNPGSVTDSPGTETYKFVTSHSVRFHRTLDDAMRSTLYDTVSDRYLRYLRDEILADVGKQYNIRPDAYSRAIGGASSGAICSFNAAWQTPDNVQQFSRVLSWIGSYTNIQWEEQPSAPEGGQDYPDKVLRGPKHNIRVWLQDGSNDMENPNWGSWPLANIRMANALKTREYDFHFSFGKGTHNGGQGLAEFPAEMIWLWRNYDPSKTEETYQMDPSEKSQPFFRVTITNRSAE